MMCALATAPTRRGCIFRQTSGSLARAQLSFQECTIWISRFKPGLPNKAFERITVCPAAVASTTEQALLYWLDVHALSRCCWLCPVHQGRLSAQPAARRPHGPELVREHIDPLLAPVLRRQLLQRLGRRNGGRGAEDQVAARQQLRPPARICFKYTISISTTIRPSGRKTVA